MASVVTINRPDVVALIEKAADEITGGNKTELVATAVRRLLAEHARGGSLFGAHPGSVRVRRGVDLTAPILDQKTDAETGREIRR
jgi:hypothetical protein